VNNASASPVANSTGLDREMNSRIVSAFRIIAFVEAMTWLGLLVGRYFSWIASRSA